MKETDDTWPEVTQLILTDPKNQHIRISLAPAIDLASLAAFCMNDDIEELAIDFNKGRRPRIDVVNIVHVPAAL